MQLQRSRYEISTKNGIDSRQGQVINVIRYIKRPTH